MKMKAREYIAKSAEAREAEVVNAVAAKLKDRLWLLGKEGVFPERIRPDRQAAVWDRNLRLAGV